ncbi:hypothetical protein Gotur_034337 [Gossypium turneri]
MSNAWNQTRRMKILAMGPTMTPEYSQWRDQRVNDNIPTSNLETARSLEEHLQVLPSEIEIIKQEFEKRSLELGKKIEQLEEEKMQLGLDVDIQRLEADKLRKGKNKAEEDLDSLKTDYKKLRRSIRTAGLGKTPEQWRQEIQEEKTKANQWEKKFQDTRAREVVLGKSLLVCQGEKTKLKVRVTELKDRFTSSVVVILVQADLLSLKYESESDQGQELAQLFRKVKALSVRAKPYITRAKSKIMDQRLEKLERLQKEMQDQLQTQMKEQMEKIQHDMVQKMQESQNDLMTKMTQLLKGVDKGKGPVIINKEENNGEPLYPPGFTPPHAQVQTELHPRRPSVLVRPQQFQGDASIPMNFQPGAGSNPGDSPNNIAIQSLMRWLKRTRRMRISKTI